MTLDEILRRVAYWNGYDSAGEWERTGHEVKAQVEDYIAAQTKEAYRKGYNDAREESFKQHMKKVDFYKVADFRLEKILFPDHCYSCHAEWDDNGFEEMPCCAKAPSNIRDSVLNWHKVETETLYNRLAQLTKQEEQE